ncbi:hypothetical protein CRE_13408 [Caenorhabditis remanei]|uniref:Sdz-33 F-box domain-containing protein n=1 Tax=Caenorhabditis remanei TaxID=31234 RepID=E3M859_CAERE|nr:hypothetical protein CRE_13408 [Caenorhabditis remanei]
MFCIRISRVVDVTVYGRYFNMSLMFYSDSVNQDALIHLDSNQPISAYFSLEIRTVRSSTPLYSFNNWLDQIKTVFCYNKPPTVVFWTGDERFEMESLKNAIKSVNQLYKGIQLKKLVKFIFRDDVSLDDMLSVNIESVIFSRSISEKQFIRFLKHWIRGSNPRLQYMKIPIDPTDLVNGKVYLNGINWIEISEESKEEIRQRHGISDIDMVQIRQGTLSPHPCNGHAHFLQYLASI